MNPSGQHPTGLISEGIALAVLHEAQKSGADYAELFLEDNESTRIEMVDGKVESANYARISGAGVRVLLGTQSAYAYCADINEQSLLDTARAAHQEASRQKSKFVDLARNYAEAQVRELERKEDLEMEEAASVARDREDWEAHDPEAVA